MLASSPPMRDTAAPISSSLRRLSQSIEGQFVAVGDRLCAAIATINGLAASLEGLTAELERPELQDAARRLVEVAREVGSMTEALAAESAILGRLLAATHEVGRRIARLRGTVGVISILGINARMTASTIAAGSEDLAAFSEEIVRVAKSAVATVEGYRREHEALLAMLKRAAEAHAAFDRAHKDTFGIVAERLHASVETVSARRAAASRATADLSGHWNRVSDGVGAVVSALQIGDMTRQRIEHVCEALEDLTGGWETQPGATAAPWSAELSEDDKRSVGAGVCRLQSVQIGHAANEFGAEMTRIAQSMEALARDTAAIVQLGGEVFGGGKRKDASFLEDLEAQLGTTRALLIECRTARAELDGVVASLTDTVRTLRAHLGSVHEIQADMQLVGLNTTLRCGRLGAEGKPLAVIAQELRQYATQTVDDARALTAALEEIDGVASTSERDRGQRGGDRIEVLQEEMTASLAVFQVTGMRLSEALAGLARGGAEVRATLLETMRDTRLADEVGSVLQAARTKLGALGPELEHGERIDERIRRVVKQRYTMQSERQIHDSLVAGSTTSAVPSSAAPTMTTDAFLEDALF